MGVAEVAALKEELAKTRSRFATEIESTKRLEAKYAELEGKFKSLQLDKSKSDEARAAAQAQATGRFGYVSLISLSIICLCVGGFIAYFSVPPRKINGLVYFAEKARVKYEGEIYNYVLAGVERKPDGKLQPYYAHEDNGCNAPAHIYPHNFENHARKHFKEKSPEVRVDSSLQPQQAEA